MIISTHVSRVRPKGVLCSWEQMLMQALAAVALATAVIRTSVLVPSVLLDLITLTRQVGVYAATWRLESLRLPPRSTRRSTMELGYTHVPNWCISSITS